MAHGGKRDGAGRKPKDEELKLIEKLDEFIGQDMPVQELKKLIESGNFNAIKLYMEYRYGKAKETVNTSHSFSDFDLKDMFGFDKAE